MMETVGLSRSDGISGGRLSVLFPILNVAALVAYWVAIGASGTDFVASDSGKVYTLMFLLLPALVLQVSSLLVYAARFKRRIVDLNAPNFLLSFTGTLLLVQSILIGFLLAFSYLVESDWIATFCTVVPEALRCDVLRFLSGEVFLMIQNALWLILGLFSLKAATRAPPSFKSPS